MGVAFYACTALFVALVLWGMWSDLVSLTIPDWVSIGLVLGFLACAIWAGVSMVTILQYYLVVGCAVFALGALLFFLGAFGGGDVKMLAAVAIWAGWPMVVELLIKVAFLGGVLALVLLAFRAMSLSARMAATPWIARLHRRDGGIPYGIAIGTGSLLLLPRITWWQF
jgi:prepilin peptidase CpaA